ncbi:FxsA family protein [Paenibacillus sp. L3-i20]|uniref:FxsA family protein n=1 Tax=Paenibacillus sp. L3-i20 TaxID=2905833 RepID=UPI001EE138AE|nr:FxsA family protein [Paenibacillus sp. L3-i20]GKU75777.1 membrane protein FxsA [Paenibacillus sp. L3-i20]
MYKWILAAFLIVPVVELWGILQVGDWIGGWNTFLIIIVMSAAGAYLARSEGRKVWQEAQQQLQTGQMPGRALIDGICVLLGGLLLLTPGFFSDLIGIVMLLPITRPFIRHMVLQWLEKRMRNGNFTINRF